MSVGWSGGGSDVRKTEHVLKERRFKRPVLEIKHRASAPVAPPGLKAVGCGVPNATLKGRSSTHPAAHTPFTTQLCRNPTRRRSIESHADDFWLLRDVGRDVVNQHAEDGQSCNRVCGQDPEVAPLVVRRGR